MSLESGNRNQFEATLTYIELAAETILLIVNKIVCQEVHQIKVRLVAAIAQGVPAARLQGDRIRAGQCQQAASCRRSERCG